ncbi:hypothetical protein C9374_011389 [Naegleria lovaniensis]|uniref:DNA-directed RNA polymerase III subunit RPC6 n=1 Tax=Naegleria lovaniensis TaxID=51637 RepID=A0AA88KRH3_NAELO|nr:uncharacterized protein C9374_011389 [Naegleria lovaniensis]KAG2392664.1 hypothetical protein C9374_011389 [Naegleria lovaniensis]
MKRTSVPSAAKASSSGSTPSASTLIDSAQPVRKPMTDEQRKLLPNYMKQILEELKQCEEGLTDVILKEKFPDQLVFMESINELHKKGRIRHFKYGKNMIFHYVSKEESVKFKGLTDEQIGIYQIVESAGNKGIWKKTIAKKAKKNEKDLEKILKTLESKQLIRKISDITQKKGTQIVYIAAHIEPSREITGGIWYVDGKFHSELIDKLRTETINYLEKKPKRVHEVLEHIKSMAIIDHVDLGVEDMQQIIDTLVYDGFIEKVIDVSHTGDKPLYRVALSSVSTENAFVDIPCSTCPVFDQCTENGDINPKGCPYLKEWMDF